MSWINVKDKLPEDDQIVIAIMQDLSDKKHIAMLTYGAKYKHFYVGFPMCCCVSIDGGCEVIKWLPLPEEYKNELDKD